MFNWFKKTPAQPVAELSAKAYPIAQYTAYWEKILSDAPGGYRVDIRFYNYPGVPAHEHPQVVVYGVTKDEVTKKSNAEIASYIQQFKRA